MMQFMSDECCCDLETCMRPEVFRALADPRRLEILVGLAHAAGSARTVGEVAADAPVDLSVVSRHLAHLRDADLVTAERDGRSVRYAARGAELSALLRQIADAIDSCCGGSCRCGQPSDAHEGVST
jgi:DNA-binding transcriptional ArsR family regulator